MLFFNWQTSIITCILLTHLDPFINELLNTCGIGPKLLAWLWEAHRKLMRRTHDIKHKNTGGLCECYADTGRDSILSQEWWMQLHHRDNLHATETWAASRSQDPVLSHCSYSQPRERQKTGNGWKETVLLPAIHQKDSGNHWLWDSQEEANPHGLTLHSNNKRNLYLNIWSSLRNHLGSNKLPRKWGSVPVWGIMNKMCMPSKHTNVT